MPKTKEVGFSPTLVPLNLRVVNGFVVQPQQWDLVFEMLGLFFGIVFGAEFEDCFMA